MRLNTSLQWSAGGPAGQRGGFIIMADHSNLTGS